VRYAVVAFGGLLGLGRRRIAVPADFLIVEDEGVRIDLDRERLHEAPGFDVQLPFSRREERAICAHFGVRPYWPGDDEGCLTVEDS
jgi:hypothetical protein